MVAETNDGQVPATGLRDTAGSHPLSSVHSKFLLPLAITSAGPGAVTQLFIPELSEPFAITPVPDWE